MNATVERTPVPETPAAPPGPAPARDTLWYKDAIIYECHVRAFQDSNDDGIGDFGGLASRLDYIQDLGVNTVWLLPFYPSPGRDDGYDIANYRDIHPQYGTRADFRRFIHEAHRRGLRIITELVINHTSDQHPWFQAARRAPAGSRKRNFYVWSDTPARYTGTRVIFTDTETSNWTWDKEAQAHYWHRFFSHQPDLNFDNPHVERAVTRIMKFWLDQGVDGLRLDAIPYLVEREGTTNENLRETHEVVQRIRRVIDARYADRMLLAEANQWPEDVRDYFGNGDECHMAYHFPLMPRMYMAIAQEDRYPITEIIDQTPDIPTTCQWAIFLRNHDELTLEMVTSSERDYMYRMYAADPRARLNLGIRRRLAPLLENDIDRIKLMNGLLLSMPGSPIIYYGDEIGMGDNIFLGDRNGVRTPMQWSPDRNAGFSRADPQQLYLPPIMDPIYGFQAVNVEAQTRDRSSLLNWMKRMLTVRKGTQAFGRGAMRFIRPGNRKVLAYVREYGDDTILCVVNLARSAQPVELNLAEFKGRVPIEMLGRTAFPPIGELPYLLTMPGHAFYWFRLSREAEAPAWHEERLAREDTPVLVLIDRWNSFFPEQVALWRGGLAARLRSQLEDRVLPGYLAVQRWYAGKGAPISHARLADQAQWSSAGEWLVALVDVESAAESARYFVPLTLAFEDSAAAQPERWSRMHAAAIARVRQQAHTGVVADAFADEVFCRTLVDQIGLGGERSLSQGRLRFTSTSAYADLRGEPDAELAIGQPLAQTSNTALRVGERLFLKAVRRVQPGIHPELDIGRFLTEVAHFPNVVPLAGAVEYLASDGSAAAVVLLQAFVRNQGDGWDFTVNHLIRFLEDRRTAAPVSPDAHGVYLELAHTLGERTAGLHRALATPTDDPAFWAEPITPDDVELWRGRVLSEAEATLEMLSRSDQLPEGLRADAARLHAEGDALRRRIEAVPVSAQGLKIRIHGDFHLGQVLLTRNDWVITDFEGEPARPLAARREKSSPLRDVAGMLRSFSYARAIAMQRCTLETHQDCAPWQPLLIEWERATREQFLSAYEAGVRNSRLYGSLQPLRAMLGLFELEKTLYELRYELRNRPDWAGIPLATLLELAQAH
ncbi:MAG TPA: maltose alpha-D-glucosyltransferase [Steroidobacteraceae bacterium]|nr:maltose alpha-D-glucosyltransferase [Steroidobacteraceae bacterium]